MVPEYVVFLYHLLHELPLPVVHLQLPVHTVLLASLARDQDDTFKSKFGHPVRSSDIYFTSYMLDFCIGKMMNT